MLVSTAKGKPKQILTKARNVSLKDGDTTTGRQVLLMDMAKNPELLEDIFIQENKVMVLFGGSNPICVGLLHDKYADYYNHYILKIKSWKITGGHVLGQSKFNTDINRLAYFGLNLEIEINDKRNIL